MAYQRIFWKDRIVVFNDDGSVANIIQEGTPLSAFNLNHMEEGISKTYNDTDLIKKNQLELLISRDLEGKIIEINLVEVVCEKKIDDTKLIKERIANICEIDKEKVRVS